MEWPCTVKLQNEGSLNFSKFHAEVCTENALNFLLFFVRGILRAFLLEKRRAQTIYEKSPPFFTAKSEADPVKKSQTFSGEQVK